MLRYDSSSGEVLPDDSGNLELISTEQAVRNANLVNPAYDYDPATRFANMQYQQQPMGYPTPPNPYPQQYQYPPQQMSGFGMYQGQQGGFQGYCGNPAFALMQEWGYNPYYQQMQQQDQVYYIPGFAPSGDIMLPADVGAIVSQLQLEMEAELEISYQQRVQKANQFYQRSGYNYYGIAPITYSDPAIVNKYKEKVQEILNQASQNRQTLNTNLSRIAHGYFGEEISNKEIEEIYSPREVIVKATAVQDMREQQYLSQFKPYNNAYEYQQAFAQVAQEQSKYFGEHCSLSEFFEVAEQIMFDNAMEEERLRRRDGSNLYNQDGSYRALIKQKLIERNNQNSGVVGGASQVPVQQPIDQMSFGTPVQIPGMPTLSSSGRLFEDGTLEITPPPGLGIGSNPMVIHNQQEDGYEASRKAFIESIYMDNPKPGGVG